MELIQKSVRDENRSHSTIDCERAIETLAPYGIDYEHGWLGMDHRTEETDTSFSYAGRAVVQDMVGSRSVVTFNCRWRQSVGVYEYEVGQ